MLLSNAPNHYQPANQSNRYSRTIREFQRLGKLDLSSELSMEFHWDKTAGSHERASDLEFSPTY
jgi:hypothetical protein